FSLPNVINLHLARLQEQMTVSQSLFTRLNTLAQQLQTSRVASVDDLLQIMENLTMTQQDLTQEQHDLLEARLNGLNEGQAEWLHFLDQTRSHMAQGRDLNSPEVQQMASRWRDSIMAFVGADLKLYEALMQVYQKEGAAAATWGTLDAPTFDYVLKAVALLSVREKMEEMVSFSREKMEEIVGSSMIKSSLDPFTPETREALTKGQDCMRELHLNFFGTEGLLLGLLAAETSSAAQALNNQGVNFTTAQNLIREVLGQSTVSDAEIPPEIPFTPRTRRVMELATEQAKQQGHDQIAPQHLLLGLLQEGETTGGGIATHVLKKCRVNYQTLKQQLCSD
ncbi:MAG: Clp protease N-terminal domain-containing protein, partial [Cyanobacteria bacterium P01_F01_bin.153]